MTVGEIDEYRHKFLNSSLFYNLMSLSEIGREFLKLLNDNVLLNTLEEAHGFYKENSITDDEFATLEEVFIYACENILYVAKVPALLFIEYYDQALVDLEEIEVNIKSLFEELNELIHLQDRKEGLNGKKRYRKKLVEYYIEKNKLAKDEIQKFVIHELKAFTTSNTIQYPLSNIGQLSIFDNFFTGKLPYRYSSSKKSMCSNFGNKYDITSLSVLQNKFGFLSVSTYRALSKEYYEDSENFFEMIDCLLYENEATSNDMYIDGGLFKKLISRTKESHILNSRTEILAKTIQDFKNEEYISCCYILPLQIEGIFHDICLLLDISEKQISTSSINAKLEFLKDKISFLRFYEYFSFIFPPLRNSIAHGEVLYEDYKRTAIMLFYDLNSVFDLALSDEIPINKKLKAINSIVECSDKNNKHKKMLDFIDYRNTYIPNFYELSNDIESIEQTYDTDVFWTSMENLFLEKKSYELQNCEDFDRVCIVKSQFSENKGKHFVKNKLPGIKNTLDEKEVIRKNKVEEFLKRI